MWNNRPSMAFQLALALLLLALTGHSQTAEERFLTEIENINEETKAEIEKWKPQAEAGDIQAQLELAQCYLALIPGTHASKVAPLRKQAWHWYEKAIFNPATDDKSDEAARKASLQAEKDLTLSMYLEEDEDNLRRLAAKKLPEAHYQLALLLLRADPDSDEAMKWLHGLAKVNHTRAIERLADQYSNAFCKHHDIRKSFEWHEKAAVKGDPKYIYELARMYHYGFGDKWPDFGKDMAKAYKLYQEAATYGNSDAQAYLVQPCLDAKSYDTANLLADELMKNGHAAGYYHKSRILFNGWGVPADKPKALELMQKAVDMGHFLAESELDIMKNTM